MNELMQLGASFGAPGLLIGFMIWQQGQRREQDKDRNAVDRERIAADIELAKQYSAQAECFRQLVGILGEKVK